MDTTDLTLDTQEKPETKTCTKCGLPHGYKEFSHDKYSPDGFKYHCKSCDRNYYAQNSEQICAKQRIYQRENPEKRRENHRKWVAANPQKVKEKSKKYRKENPEKTAERKKRWISNNQEKYKLQQARTYQKNRSARLVARRIYVEQNKEVVNLRLAEYRKQHRKEAKEKSKKWREENPEKQREQTHIKRARKAGALVSDLTLEQWEFIKMSYNFQCAYCGKKPKLLTKDHITPLVKGGYHSASNIVPACRSCNSKKHTGPPLRPVQPVLLCP